MREPLLILTSWGGAQYFDWWTVVHLLGGVAIAYMFRLFGFSFQYSLLLVGSILIGWEIYEWVTKIPEPWMNSVIDLIVGFLGVLLAYKINPFADQKTSIAFAVFMLVVWMGLNFWGWVSWSNRQAQILDQKAEQKKLTIYE